MDVLLIEDDEYLGSEIAEYLRRRGHSVLTCSTLAAARAALSGPVERKAIICDVGLPDGDGFLFYKGLPPKLKQSRWILMSGSHDLERLKAEHAGHGNLTIVEKPVPMRVLKQLLDGPPRDGDVPL